MYIRNSQFLSKGQILDNHIIEISNGKISNIIEDHGQELEGKVILANDSILSAALIDLHINGGYQFYYTQHVSVEAALDIAKASQDLGCYYTMPTVITSSEENILKGIQSVREAQAINDGILGIHIEGPFINPKRRGAHLEKYIQTPTLKILEKFIKQSEGLNTIMTIAPELFTEEQINLLLSSHIKISIGHSNANYGQAKFAFDKGINLCTHLYNAMPPLHHRDPGLIGAIFNSSHVFAPIIVDGQHCSFEMVKIAYKQKSDKLFLISDALFLGSRVESFQWEEFDARLINDQYINTEGNLAGANISLLDAVKNMVEKLNFPVEEALMMASFLPAKVMGLSQKIGDISIGCKANLIEYNIKTKEFNTLVL